MQFTCKHCKERFDKQLNFRQRIEKYIPEFCSKDCEISGLRSKRMNKFIKRKKPKTSKEEREFGNILYKFYGGLKRQYRLKGYYHNYDFYIPELGTIIEYDGQYFHSKPGQRLRDLKHNIEAKKRGVPVSRITDKEWKQVLKEGSLTRDKLIRVIRKNIID